MVKFQHVHEAEAAASAYINKGRDEHILGVPQIRIKYVQNPGAPAFDSFGTLPLETGNSLGGTAAEDEEKRRLLEQKREEDAKRKALIESYNNDIQAQVRRLNLEGDGMTAQAKADIEKKIQEDKARLNALLSEQKAANAKNREDKLMLSRSSSTTGGGASASTPKGVTAGMYTPTGPKPFVSPATFLPAAAATAIKTSGPVELVLFDIGKKWHESGVLLKALMVRSCILSQ